LRWIAAAALAGVALAGCGPTNEDEPANDAVIAEQEEMAQRPIAGDEPPNGVDAGDDRDGTDPPEPGQDDGGAGTGLPPPSGLRFVGLWASNAANCDGRAWRFSADRLQTPAGSVCNFTDLKSVAGGYDIAATCTAEGPPTEDRLEIRFAESAKAMLFESDVIADAGLVWCGRG
jgi:hypothetical protein